MLMISVLSLALTPIDTAKATLRIASPPPIQAVSKGARLPAKTFDASRCRGISDLSQKKPPVFQEGANGEWECTSFLEFPETGHAPSIFVQIRGAKGESWSTFRLKLNFGSPLSRQSLSEKAVAIIESLIGDRTQLEELRTRLAARQEFESSIAGIGLRYRQEGMDPTRFNLFGKNIPPLRGTLPARSSARQ